MRIDIFSDTVCPWCYIGKRHLETALVESKSGDANIQWHAFQLNPDLPPQGRDRREYLDAKFGSPEAAKAIHARVREAGKNTGIDFQFDRIGRSPNTFNSHRLIRLAETEGKGEAMVEALFRAYFLEGRDIGDDTTLAELARDAGIEGDVNAWLAGEGERNTVLNDLRAGREMGITGVPFFILDNRYTLSGAQPVEIFVQALQAAQQKARSIN
ncbi:MAG: DsbA family oxidoreductase [Gammaproteobacteria bacterium]